ncbi:MAG: hypothetical protein KAS04_01570 [Candidatus Aenigmarchaeota archaeon]|nr:hypothetical protein [Candidatus Aenigmarchaeota archaeon]
MSFDIVDKLEWGELATFVPNKKLPVYNWFYYKEGYSRDLIFKLIDMFGVKKGDLVLDQFCGTGTTNLACRQKGIDSVGFEVSPLALFAAEVKTRDYDIELLRETLLLIRKAKFRKIIKSWVPSNIKKYFNPHTLDDVLFFRQLVKEIDDGPTREFFRLALISAATRCSYMYKDGSVVKVRKHPIPPFRKFYNWRLKRMIKNLEKFEQGNECRTVITRGDARKLKLDDEEIDFVMTSPPYLNKIEYTKIYGVEEFLFFGTSKKRGVRSYIGMQVEPERIFPELPDIANAYFADMRQTLKEMYRVCKPGAKAAIVVGNGCFPDGVIQSDELISELAEKIGFSVDKIHVLNKRWCTKNRTEKVGELRESMVVLEK